MKSDEKLWNIVMDVYRQCYKEASPSADFDLLIKSGEAMTPDFYMKYYLPDDRIHQIIDAHCRKSKLNTRDAHKVSSAVWLGSSPRGTRISINGSEDLSTPPLKSSVPISGKGDDRGENGNKKIREPED